MGCPHRAERRLASADLLASQITRKRKPTDGCELRPRPRNAGRCPVRLGRSAAVGDRALGLLGSHDCDRQPELLNALRQVPAQPV
jgi:hypothetical protein